jgi:hypothetical protein
MPVDTESEFAPDLVRETAIGLCWPPTFIVATELAEDETEEKYGYDL